VPLSLETGFRFRLEDNIIIKGQIDRIDKNHEGKLIVIDYKTGKVKDKIRAEDKKQLLIYQIAMETSQELRNLGEIKELMYYFLDNSSRQSFKGNSEEIQETKNDMIMTIQKIKSKIFQPAPAKEICKYCDFKDICDYKI
jgi:DNA helicase-2/ATP-dependent DNA helicase PcrA